MLKNSLHPARAERARPEWADDGEPSEERGAKRANEEWARIEQTKLEPYQMDSSIWVWLTPTLMALVFWGLGQGFVNKYISEIPPARFCLYFVVAKGIVNLWYFGANQHLPPLAPEGMRSFLVALLAYIMDGMDGG